MTTKHTPGKWSLHPTDREKVCANQQGIAVMSGMYRDTIEREANAALIAQAPAMLETLEMVERCFNADPVDPLQAFMVIERVREVIKQARGE